VTESRKGISNSSTTRKSEYKKINQTIENSSQPNGEELQFHGMFQRAGNRNRHVDPASKNQRGSYKP